MLLKNYVMLIARSREMTDKQFDAFCLWLGRRR